MLKCLYLFGSELENFFTFSIVSCRWSSMYGIHLFCKQEYVHFQYNYRVCVKFSTSWLHTKSIICNLCALSCWIIIHCNTWASWIQYPCTINFSLNNFVKDVKGCTTECTGQVTERADWRDETGNCRIKVKPILHNVIYIVYFHLWKRSTLHLLQMWPSPAICFPHHLQHRRLLSFMQDQTVFHQFICPKVVSYLNH